MVCVLVFRKKLFLQIYDNVQNHLLLKKLQADKKCESSRNEFVHLY